MECFSTYMQFHPVLVTGNLVLSPFLLRGVFKSPLESWEARMPELIADLCHSPYVDDLISRKLTVDEARKLKKEATEARGSYRNWAPLVTQGRMEFVMQPSSFRKGLVTTRARLSKQGLTELKLELVTAHMITT